MERQSDFQDGRVDAGRKNCLHVRRLEGSRERSVAEHAEGGEMRWSEDDLRAYEERRKLRRAEKDVVTEPGTIAPETMVRPVKSSAYPSISRGPKLNKLERDWLAVLKTRWLERGIFVQSIKLRLADGVWYIPDFVVFDFNQYEECAIRAYETKGPHRFREKGILKAKMAAETFKQITFYLVTRKDGQWKEEQL